MINRWTVAIAGLVVAVIVLVLAIGRMSSATSQGRTAPTPSQAELDIPATTAEAVIVPARRAQLAFIIGGQVAKVAVQAGDSVEAGQVLASLEAAELDLAVKAAEDTLVLQEARLAQAKAAARPEDIAAAQAEVAAAKAGVNSATSVLAQASANLDKVRTGPTASDLEIATRQVDQAKNNLWSAQARRDGIGGQVESGHLGKYELDAANAEVARYETALEIAQLQFEETKNGARTEDRAAASAQTDQARGELDAARARLAVAQAQLAKLRAAAREEDLAIYEVQVRQAQTALEQAQAQRAQAELRAPFSGRVVSVGLREGELISPGNAGLSLADLAVLQVETTDLEESGLTTLQLGQPVHIVVNAFEDKTLSGKVVDIGYQGVVAPNGDTIYPVTISLDEQDPTLHWGMTAKVEFQ